MLHVRDAGSISLLLLAALLGTGCGGGAGDNTPPDAGSDAGDPGTDTDGDGLTDREELGYGTNPGAADTDGDGYNDFQEINDLAFDPEIDAFRFNPRIADMPRLEVELLSAPRIGVNFSNSGSATVEESTERTTSTSRANSREWGGSESLAIEQSHTSSVSVTVGASWSDGLSVEVSGSYSETYGETNETTSEWSEAQTTENSDALARAQSRSSSMGWENQDGFFEVAARITNRGNIAYVLDNFTMTAYENDPLDPLGLNPIGQLEAGSGGFTSTTLIPGASAGPFTFSRTDLNLSETYELLSDPGGIIVAPLTFRLLGMGEIDFSLAATNIFARTATVIVDFGLGTTPIQVRVATVLDRSNPGVALPAVLSDVMNLPMVVGTSAWEFGEDRTPGNTFSGISSVRGQAASGPDTSYWVLTHTRNQTGSSERVTDVYNPVVEAYDPAAITVRTGEVIHLVFIRDTDRDSLSERTEVLHGTRTDMFDTDGDGLGDGAELAGWNILVDHDNNGGTPDVERRVYTNPLDPDTDDDLVNDADEREAGTDPSNFIANTLPSVGAMLSASGFDATAALTLNDPDGTITRVEIDWGDGTPKQVLAAGPYTTGPGIPGTLNVVHRYASTMTFNVDVEVFDNRLGSSGVLRRTVTPAVAGPILLFAPFDASLDSSTGPDFLAAQSPVDYATDRRSFGERAVDLWTTHMSADSEQLLSTDSFVGFASGSFSMSAWVRFPQTPNSNDRVFGLGNSFSLYAGASGRMAFGPRTGTLLGSAQATVTDTVGLDMNIWRLWTGVVENLGNGMSAVRLYRDGNLVASTAVSGTFTPAQTCRFYVGNIAADNDCTSQDAESGRRSYGQVDDLRLYPRALTAGEVALLFATTP